MTSQTPAPQAGSAPLLPASPSSAPNAPQPSVKEDFLAVILQALTAKPNAANMPAAPPSAREKPALVQTAANIPQASAPKSDDSDNPAAPPAAREKSSSAQPSAPDVTAASMLLALLIPPLPVLPKLAPRKASGSSAPSAVAALTAPSNPSASSVPSQSAGENKPARATPAEAVPPLPAQAEPAKDHESKVTPPSGTSVANTGSRMSLNTERNEIAARKEQKLPVAAVSAAGSADAGGSSPDNGARLPLSFSWHDAPADQLAIIDLSAKAAGPAVPETVSTADVPVRAASPAPMDHLEQMITREALTIKQIGAQSLGVALKLDSNTQLFLQLTNTNGSVQASLRCDRGQFAPEDAQWAQLRQSLASQNVELLPMTGSAGSNLNFQQSAGEHSRQPASREDWPAASAAAQPAQQRKQPKQQNRSRKNWESWA